MEYSKNLCSLIQKRLEFKTVLRENINASIKIPAYGNDMKEKGGKRNFGDRIDDFAAGRDNNLGTLGFSSSNRKQEPSEGIIVDEITATKNNLHAVISFIKIENPNKQLIIIRTSDGEKIIVGWENFGQAGSLLRDTIS